MATSPNPIDPAEDEAGGPCAWERALLGRQLERLDRLADMGLAVAGAIERRAVAAPPDAVIGHAAMDFARVSRAVRMTLALQSRLVREFKTPPRAGSARADNDDVRWEVEWAPERPAELARKALVQGAVRRAAEDSGLDAETVERLATEAGERLERDDIHADILNRSFDEIVARICEDLGLGRPRERPFAAGGGPPAERSEKRVVEGESQARHALRSPVSDSS